MEIQFKAKASHILNDTQDYLHWVYVQTVSTGTVMETNLSGISCMVAGIRTSVRTWGEEEDSVTCVTYSEGIQYVI